MPSLPLLAMVVFTIFTLQKTDAGKIAYIVGGERAEKDEFPHFVLIEAVGYMCGGSLISAEWVLTAGHCLHTGVPISAYLLKFGLIQRDDPWAVTRRAWRTVRHKKYEVTGNNVYNDIALIMVDESLSFSAAIKPIPLPEQDQPLPEKVKGVIIGFGKLDSRDYRLSRYLMKAEIPNIKGSDCSTLMKRYHIDLRSQKQLCYGYHEGGMDSCQGDSGGPLIVDGYLRGIVSIGYDCALPGTAGIYTNVDFYRSWIEEVAGV